MDVHAHPRPPDAHFRAAAAPAHGGDSPGQVHSPDEDVVARRQRTRRRQVLSRACGRGDFHRRQLAPDLGDALRSVRRLGIRAGRRRRPRRIPPLQRRFRAFQTAVRLSESRHRLAPRGVQHVVSARHQIIHLALQLLTQGFGFGARAGRALHAFLNLPPFALQLVQPVFEQKMSRLHQRARFFKYLGGQPKSLRHRHGVASSGHADSHLVGRFERIGV